MACYRSTRTLQPCEAAYLAGLIDGEGTITLTRRHRNENRQLVVSISNNERPLLDYVKHTIGAGRITAKRTHSPNHAPSYTYCIDNRQALALVRQITPFLQTYKAERARLILQAYVSHTPRNGKYSSQQQQLREEFERSVLDARAHQKPSEQRKAQT